MIKQLLPFTLSLIIALLCGIVEVKAQSSQVASPEETEIIQNVWGMEKKAIIEEYMALSESEAQLFWPVYDAYAAKRKVLGSERIATLQDYVNNYNNMTNDKAEELTKEIFKNNVQLDKLQMKYYKAMKKAISPLRASQFMQLESYLETIVRSEVQDALPYIGDLEKKRIN